MRFRSVRVRHLFLFVCAFFCAGQSITLAQGRAVSVGNVAASGHLGRDVVVKGDKVRFWITIENRSAAPILNVHLDRLERDGFTKSQWCWGSSFDKEACGTKTFPGPACLAPGQKQFPASDEFVLCPYLKPGEALTVWGDLTAADEQPPHELSALVSWKVGEKTPAPCKLKDQSKCPAPQPEQQTEAAQFVALGRAEPIAALRFFFRRYTPRAEILIPAAITVLGFFFTWWSSRKQRQNEIWTTMLGKVHDFAMHYYMPTASVLAAAVGGTDTYRPAANAFRVSGTPIPVAESEAGRKGFYFLMMFHWWRRETFLKVGAYHLRTRPGEDLLYLLATRDHDVAFLGTSEALRRALDRIKNTVVQETTSDEVLALLDGGDPDFTALWNRYHEWAASNTCNRDLGVLEAFISVTQYEVNRVSKDWYPGKVKIVAEKRELDAFNEKAETSADIRNYLAAAKRGWRIPWLERSY